MAPALAEREKVEVSLTAPSNAAVYTAPASIPLSAVAVPALIPSVAAEHAKNDPQAIVRVEFFAGTAPIGSVAGPQPADRYSFTWVNPAPGVYSITARATNEKGDAASSSAATITVNAPPTVSLSSAAAVVTAPGTINLTAAPADSDGTIQKVEFFRGTTLVGTATAAPFSVQLENLAASTYSFTARATDNHGATGDSGGVTVIVNDPPSVTLASPPAVVTAPGTLTLTAVPADNDGTIQKVDFLRGNTLVGTATAAPFSVQLENLAASTYNFTARATDNHGATGDSGGVTVIVNERPTVELRSSTTVVTAPGIITLTASPADADGIIQKVEFFRGTTLLGTATASPYQLEVADLSPGSYAFSALAVDNHDATGSSTELTVRVNSAPTITLTSTATSFRAPANIPLSALAFDLDGTIAKVELFNGSDLIATLTADPFNVTWAQVPQGTYTLTARVTDDLGASVSSEPLAVTVNAAKGKLYFIHVDHLNTPRLVADEQQRTTWQWNQIEPFAVSLPDENPMHVGTFELPMRLPGQYYDKETGINQNAFRDYDPALGRYLEADPIGLTAGLNLFAYVLGNPLTLRDVLGLDVRVSIYYGMAAGAGHVGIGIATGAGEQGTVGFYPAPGANGSVGSTAGAVLPDPAPSPNSATLVIPTTPQQDACITQCINDRTANPGTYSLTARNCKDFVFDCLTRCGIKATNVRSPPGFFNFLRQKYERCLNDQCSS